MNWNQPKCEACWIRDNWVSNIGGEAPAVRQPVRVIDAELEQCAFCGSPTISGIYVRAHPTSVPFPACAPDEVNEVET